nr:vitellogenin receptor-like [Leptinotarsa decemlineata]
MKLVCNGNHDCYDGSDEDGLCSTSCEGSANRCSQICNKTPMGPSCECRSGFILMGNGVSCMDLNECQNHPPVCSQICHNQDGGFKCDCYDGFLLRSDKKSCKAEGNPMSLIFSEYGQIRELSQLTNILSVVFATPAPKITGLDVLVNPRTIYFSMEETSTIHKIDMTSKTRHFIRNIGQPQDIAVDWSTHNIYYYNTDTNSKSISICSFEEKCAKLIDVDMHRQVAGLVVDSVNKFLFYALNSWYVFNSPSYVIYRCNLDGTEKTEIMKTTDGFVSDITFDHNSRILYYMDMYLGQINKITYDGSFKTPIYSNITRSSGLKFFENRLYYSTNGGFVSVCRLYGFLRCDSFRLHNDAIDFFTILQETLQPSVGNPCKNHNCSNLCVPAQFGYKCLCQDGTLLSGPGSCQINENTPESDKKYTVHSVAMTQAGLEEGSSGTVAVAITIPLLVILFALGAIYFIKKKHAGALNVRMRFYTPHFGRTVQDENPILKPGQHEYTNPVHFNKEDNELTLETAPIKLNDASNV